MPDPNLPPAVFRKAAGWSRLCDIDFADFSEFSDSPVQAIASASVPAPPAGLSVTGVAFSGTRAQLLVAGGTAGQSYGPFDVVVTTAPGGYVLSWPVLVVVS